MQPTQPFAPPPPPVTEHPAVDISLPANPEGTTLSLTYPVEFAKEDLTDKWVPVRRSVLSRCRRDLESLACCSQNWSEAMFGISMLLWGAIFSALISKVPLESVHGILFYILAPMIAVGTGVAYFIRRGNSRDSNRAVANALLEALPVGSTIDSEGGQK